MSRSAVAGPRRAGALARALAACLLVLSAAAAADAQNPLARKSKAPDPFARRFVGDGLVLVLEARGAGYAGSATLDGETWPVTAAKRATGTLAGDLSVDGERYGFTATLEGDRLVLESEGQRWDLAAEGATSGADGASRNPLARAPAPSALDGVWEGPVDVLRHPDGIFRAEVPEGWTVADVGDGVLVVNPGLTDTLDCLLIVTWGELDEDERGVDVVTLFERGEAELLEGLRRDGVDVQRAREPARKVAVGSRAGAEQSWKGRTQGTPVEVWCGALVEREWSLAVVAIVVDGQQRRFLPGCKRLFRTLDPKAPERDLALERALAGARFASSDSLSGGSFITSYEFGADGSVRKEMLASGMVGLSIEVGADSEEWGTWRSAGPLLYLGFRDGQQVARVESDGTGRPVALVMGQARYTRRN